MLFWEYTLLLFSLLTLLLAMTLLLKERKKKSKKLFFLFFSFVLYNILLTLYSWTKFNDGLFVLLSYVQFIPLMFYAIMIYGHLNGTIDIAKTKEENLFANPRNKYEKTGLSETFSLELKQKLEEMMVTKKPYLNHELRLDDIADLLDVSRHHVSQVINAHFNMGFYDYINAHRIEEAKNKLCSSGFETSSQSISDIAYLCGFNNRVSFYKAFKKFTHTTPTEFLDEMVMNAHG